MTWIKKKGAPDEGVPQNRYSARVYLLAGRNSIFISLGNMCILLGQDPHIVLCKQSDRWIVWWKSDPWNVWKVVLSDVHSCSTPLPTEGLNFVLWPCPLKKLLYACVHFIVAGWETSPGPCWETKLQACFCWECRTDKNLPATMEIALTRLICCLLILIVLH